MIKLNIISVGKMKEKYFAEAISEYEKRLKRYAQVSFFELKDEPTPENPTEREKELILSKEGERIKEKIPAGSYVITLCVEGKQLSSEELSAQLERTVNTVTGNITVIIGGSLGLSQDIKNLSDFKLSFSKMTFPHRLMRVILLEQLYRAFTIQEGKTYHK